MEGFMRFMPCSIRLQGCLESPSVLDLRLSLEFRLTCPSFWGVQGPLLWGRRQTQRLRFPLSIFFFRILYKEVIVRSTKKGRFFGVPVMLVRSLSESCWLVVWHSSGFVYCLGQCSGLS